MTCNECRHTSQLHSCFLGPAKSHLDLAHDSSLHHKAQPSEPCAVYKSPATTPFLARLNSLIHAAAASLCKCSQALCHALRPNKASHTRHTSAEFCQSTACKPVRCELMRMRFTSKPFYRIRKTTRLQTCQSSLHILLA